MFMAHITVSEFQSSDGNFTSEEQGTVAAGVEIEDRPTLVAVLLKA